MNKHRLLIILLTSIMCACWSKDSSPILINDTNEIITLRFTANAKDEAANILPGERLFLPNLLDYEDFRGINMFVKDGSSSFVSSEDIESAIQQNKSNKLYLKAYFE